MELIEAQIGLIRNKNIEESNALVSKSELLS